MLSSNCIRIFGILLEENCKYSVCLEGSMKVFLRILRIISFVGFLFVFILVIGFNVPFLEIVKRGIACEGFTGYICLISAIMFISYPVLFLLTILYMKLSGRHVYLIYGKGELSLFGLFRQNELRPFIQFLTDSFNKIRSERFPYNVDFARGMTVSRYNVMRIVAFAYRFIRCVILITLIVAAFYFGGRYVAQTI